MGSFSQTIVLPAPLCDARITRYTVEEVLAQLRERERHGYEQGRAAGERAFAQELLQQRTDMLAIQKGVLAQVRDSVQGTLSACEDVLVDLAAEIAMRVIGNAAVTREVVQHAVGDALRQVHDTAEFTVLLHPDDLKLLENASGQPCLSEGSEERARFATDTSIGRGGCVVRTAFGVLDGRREVKIAALKEALRP